MMPVSGETSLATIQSHPLRVTFGGCMGNDVIGLCRKANRPACGRPSVLLRQLSRGCRGFPRVLASGRVSIHPFLILLRPCINHMPICHCCRKDRLHLRQRWRSLQRHRSISCAVCNPHDVHPLRGAAHPTGPVTKVTSAPYRGERFAPMAVPCAPDERLAM